MLQPCSELPSVSTEENNYECLVDIAKRYVISYVINSGKYGTVIKVTVATDNTQVYAVKISALDENAVADVSIACQINSLHRETGAFLRTFGWISCIDVPGPWKTHSKDEYPELLANAVDRKDALLYIFMDLANEEFRDRRISLDSDEIVAMLYLLLHGLYVARRRLGAFSHHDVHDENIMLQTVNANTKINVLGYQITNLRFVPKFIDYGLSTTSVVKSDDVSEVVHALTGKVRPREARIKLERVIDNMEEFETAKESMSNDSECILRLLEAIAERYADDNPHFTERDDPIQQCCIQCSAEATCLWNGTDVAFCGTHCANQKTAVMNML
jgi:hypothetical protein